ncbi:MAG: glycosyltransferase [Candidatus Melainabacteria bacterium]|nr:glycosyltransferase [Candidatus Melainabacteria bacterium]
MHFIVTAIGSAGDINPMLMIACELDRRGHSVDFIANGYFEQKVEKAGLKLLPLGSADLYLKAVDDARIWNPPTAFQAVWETIKDSLRLSVSIIEENLRPDSILVGSSLAFGNRITQEKHGVKGSTVHLAPSVILSGHDPMAMPGLPFVSSMPLQARHLLMSAIDLLWLDTTCRDDLNRIRKEYGLPPIKSVMRNWMHSPDQVIGTFPSWFAEPQPDWPPNTVLTGFPVYDRPEDQSLTPELENFLQAGDAPVVFTAGSAMAYSKKHFETAIAATKMAGLRAVLVSAFPDQIPPNLPPNILHVPYAPFSVLFPRACVAQHHGGIGTSIQGLAAGVPQLVTPFAHDQFDNAFRLAKLGVAREINKLNPTLWAKTVTELQNTKSYQAACQRTKQLMIESPPALVLAADALETLGR